MLFLVIYTVSYAGDANCLNLIKAIDNSGNKVNFEEQILASFLGSFFGFAFAVILFLLTNQIIEKRNKKMLLRHLKREFEYDISKIQEWIDEIDKILRKITANDINVYSYLQYSYFQRAFVQQAFNSGIMYNKLDNEEISQLNTILSHFDIGYEGYINSLITQWKSSSIKQTDVLFKFEFEKDSLIRFKQQYDEIIKNVNK